MDTGASSRGAGSAFLAVCVGAMALASCNAVFGLEDRSFGTGGGGGAGGGSTTGTGGSTASTTGSTGTCGPEDIARSGDFEPGWEGSWTGYNLTVFGDVAGAQPVLHAIVIDGPEDPDEGVLTHTPAMLPACADTCLRATSSFFANSDFHLYVFAESDVQGLRIGLIDLAVSAGGEFETLQSGPPCRLPDGFETLDRLMFQAVGLGDYLLDDVTLDITECTAEAPTCTLL